MDDGFYKPKYRDKKTGQLRVAKVYWCRDPVSGRRASTGARTIEGARAWRAERERRAANPHYAASHEATVGEWVKKVNALKRERKAEGTADMYRVKLGHVVRIFGEDAPMATITPDTVDAFVTQRQGEGASNNTLGKELTGIVQICKHAKRSGQYAGDISSLRPVGFSIDYTPRRAFLRREWLPKLAKKATPEELAAVKFIVATGARLSEYERALRLDVNTRTWLVTLRGTKTKKSARVVPIPSIFRALLKESLPLLEKKVARLSHVLPAACLRAKLPRLSPNDFRRTHSTWLIEHGVDKRLVADSLGHTDSRMVERVYGHADPAAVLEVMEAQLVRKPSKSRASSKRSRRAS